ncbi:uncharacterized protein KK0381_21960 [Streptococcus pneumoniae]|nr:uncharacterized protein KK0381_21960 [Streptococcus pneumoniae]
MKLSNLLLFAGAAAGSYLVTKNRQTITDEVLNTTDRVQAIKDDVDIIQTACKSLTSKKNLSRNTKKT